MSEARTSGMVDSTAKARDSVRGVALIGFRDWTRNCHGEAGWQRLLEEVSPAVREILESSLLPSASYPVACYVEVTVGISDVWGAQTKGGVADATAAIAEAALVGYMNTLVNMSSPKEFLLRLPVIWRHYFDVGRVSVELRGPSGAKLVIREAHELGPALAYAAVGWIGWALGKAGAKGLESEVVVDTELGGGTLVFRWM